jgi:hypothetical protein
MRVSFEVNGYKFGLCCTKASYKKMDINSKTYKALCFIKYNHYCSRKQVQQFVYGESKYSDEQSWRDIFSHKLSEKMRIRGMNREILSYETGISVVSIGKYLNGKSTPSTYNMELIATALSCTIRELLPDRY